MQTFTNETLQNGVTAYCYNFKNVVATATGDTVNNILGFSVYSSMQGTTYYDNPILRWDETNMMLIPVANASNYNLSLTVIYN